MLGIQLEGVTKKYWHGFGHASLLTQAHCSFRSAPSNEAALCADAAGKPAEVNEQAEPMDTAAQEDNGSDEDGEVGENQESPEQSSKRARLD